MKKVLFISLLTMSSSAFALPATTGGNTTPLRQLFLDEPDDLAIELLPFDSAPLSLRLFDLSKEDRASLLRPPAFINYLEEPVNRPTFESRRILKQPSGTLSDSVMISFTPDPKKSVQSWKAQFVDGHGRVVKEMSGTGTPAELRWDGTEEGWMRVRAGEPYNVVFNGKLNDGTSLHQSGQPVTFEAVCHKIPDQTTLMFAGAPLFSVGNTPSLTPKGEDRLLAAAGILATHTNDAVTIDIFSKDSIRAAAQQKLVVSTLANLLTRDPAELLSEIQVDPNEEEEIRITIVGFGK